MNKRSKREQFQRSQLRLAMLVDQELEKIIKNYNKIVWWLTHTFPHEIWKPIFKITISTDRVKQFPGSKYSVSIRGKKIGSFIIPDREVFK